VARNRPLVTDSAGSNSPASPDQKVANPGWVRPPRIYLATILLGIVGHLLWRDQFVSRVIGVPTGSLLVLVSVALFLAATREFKAAGTPVPGNQVATAIVRRGPYRLSRNPIYLAFSLLQLGLALLVNSLTMVITLVPAVALMALVVIPREERYLAQRFPSEYAAYKASTRRWL
jgi:protein-S-isoprenylcysteine O-methyltransferase Ste14